MLSVKTASTFFHRKFSLFCSNLNRGPRCHPSNTEQVQLLIAGWALTTRWKASRTRSLVPLPPTPYLPPLPPEEAFRIWQHFGP